MKRSRAAELTGVLGQYSSFGPAAESRTEGRILQCWTLSCHAGAASVSHSDEPAERRAPTGLARLVRLSGQRLLLISSVCWRAFCDLWQMTSHFERVFEQMWSLKQARPLCVLPIFLAFFLLFFSFLSILISERSSQMFWQMLSLRLVTWGGMPLSHGSQ